MGKPTSRRKIENKSKWIEKNDEQKKATVKTVAYMNHLIVGNEFVAVTKRLLIGEANLPQPQSPSIKNAEVTLLARNSAHTGPSRLTTSPV